MVLLILYVFGKEVMTQVLPDCDEKFLVENVSIQLTNIHAGHSKQKITVIRDPWFCSTKYVANLQWF